ncbi:hypothetical protein Tco_0088634 [Tanacetum coccineum]
MSVQRVICGSVLYRVYRRSGSVRHRFSGSLSSTSEVIGIASDRSRVSSLSVSSLMDRYRRLSSSLSSSRSVLISVVSSSYVSCELLIRFSRDRVIRCVFLSRALVGLVFAIVIASRDSAVVSYSGDLLIVVLS